MKVLTRKRRNAIIDMLGIHYTNCETADQPYIDSYTESAKILEDFIRVGAKKTKSDLTK